MLTISSDAYAKVADDQEHRYIARIADFLRQSVPGLTKEPEPRLFTAIRRLKEQAGEYGMVSEQAVAAYALTAAHLGLDFVERFRGVRQILFMNCPQEEKAQLLQAFTVRLLQTLGRR